MAQFGSELVSVEVRCGVIVWGGRVKTNLGDYPHPGVLARRMR